MNNTSSDTCTICERVARSQAGENPHLVYEFPNSVLVVGDHQYFEGYCILLLKEHVRELHEIEPAVRDALFREMMAATEAIAAAYHPWKMNHACLGNQDPHVHWHLFPRYETDPDHKNHPFLHSGEFAAYTIDAAAAREVAARIRAHLAAG